MGTTKLVKGNLQALFSKLIKYPPSTIFALLHDSFYVAFPAIHADIFAQYKWHTVRIMIAIYNRANAGKSIPRAIRRIHVRKVCAIQSRNPPAKPRERIVQMITDTYSVPSPFTSTVRTELKNEDFADILSLPSDLSSIDILVLVADVQRSIRIQSLRNAML